MPCVVKYSAELKASIVNSYLKGEIGFRATAIKYQISQTTLKNWIRLYKIHGVSGLQPTSKENHYSAVLKLNAVLDYLSGTMTRGEVLTKYGIRHERQLSNWILKYNGNKKLKASGNGGAAYMSQGRKTTFEERVEIVKYCIEHENNYAETSNKYQVSYQQVYSWTVKFQKAGINGLFDRRGKRKPENKMSELEKLRAENKLLIAQKHRLELENEFLKKLEEIERKWS